MTKALNEEFISQLMLKCSVVTELEEQVLLAIREKTNQAQVWFDLLFRAQKLYLGVCQCRKHS